MQGSDSPFRLTTPKSVIVMIFFNEIELSVFVFSLQQIVQTLIEKGQVLRPQIGVALFDTQALKVFPYNADCSILQLAVLSIWHFSLTVWTSLAWRSLKSLQNLPQKRLDFSA